MPIQLCQCNGLCEQRLVDIFNELEREALLPDNTLKAAGRILQAGRIKPIRETLGRVAGCCGGCLPHIERIVEEKRSQAAIQPETPVLEPMAS